MPGQVTHVRHALQNAEAAKAPRLGESAGRITCNGNCRDRHRWFVRRSCSLYRNHHNSGHR